MSPPLRGDRGIPYNGSGMSIDHANLSTGISGLDKIIRGLLPGDNIVFQVPSIGDYLRFVRPYAEFACDRDQKLVYFRFASHAPLLDAGEYPGIQINTPDPSEGFEPFISSIHSTIKKNGRGGYYVFDSLSELTDKWYSDRMLGNFFMLTCPYLLDMEALAYFGILRQEHSHNALHPIHNTAQVILDVYNSEGQLYIHPLKVQQRYSSTMHMLHREDDGNYLPVTNSALNSRILSFSPFQSESGSYEDKDMWNRNFAQAHQALLHPTPDARRQEAFHTDRLLKMAVTRDERFLPLARQYFSLKDLLTIGRRIIGTGLIGGKSTGMLLARAMLQKKDPALSRCLEVHDSFFVGSDVFYTYMVINGCWWIRHQQKEIDTFLSVAEYARRVILTGQFPEDIIRKFSDMLDYFGQSPIIVRSSSLLEDNFGNAFSGKYESIFCPNQGSREKRLENLLTAIKTIYASTLSEKALQYRAHLGILDKDEQMPLLIQRVSGDLHKNYFFPAVAGVGYSYNPYVWDKEIDPESGVLRIVYGMGTRAVDRSDEDYTRVVALNAPEKRPETGMDEIRRYSQRRVDLLDLEANQLVAVEYQDMEDSVSPNEKSLLTSLERETQSRYISFTGLFRNTPFIQDMRKILRTLEEAYTYPVDVEFTLNFTAPEEYRINIVQCRPFEVRRNIDVDLDFSRAEAEKVLLASPSGTVIGRNREIRPQRIIYVSGEKYSPLTVSQKHSTARTIGRVMKNSDPSTKTILIGPGRWGTTTVFLGIPVSFSEISRADCICEVVDMGENLIPDVSLGTHFFNDLVELDILYLALYPRKEGTIFQPELLLERPNQLLSIVDDEESRELADVVHVVDTDPGKSLLAADLINQHYLLSLE